jgi:5-methylcytosine-specific restriction endonuclease McrA
VTEDVDRRGALERRGLTGRDGAGVKRAPPVWRATGPPARAPTRRTADPAYVRYLGSAAWARKRAAILVRADGSCEACGAALPERAAEVHFRTYSGAGEELPEDLIAVCPGCHRRAHAAG